MLTFLDPVLEHENEDTIMESEDEEIKPRFKDEKQDQFYAEAFLEQLLSDIVDDKVIT